MIRETLALISAIVPRYERDTWRREWLGEFEFARQHGAAATASSGWRMARLWAAWQHAWWLRWQSFRLGTLGQDVRHAWRSLRRRPAFAIAAVLTLALGIAGTTAIVSVVRAVLWRPLPFPESDRLVMVAWTSPTASRPDAWANSVSPPDFADWRAASTSFSGMAAIRDDGPSLTGEGVAEQLTGNAVTGDFFGLLGVPASLGRVLAPADDAAGAPDVVILSDRLWRRRFGADPGVVGRRILLDRVSREVVGVMPAAFDFPADADVWIPLRFTTEDLTKQRGAHYLTAVARLRNGVSLETAAADTIDVGRRVATANHVALRDASVQALPLRRALVGDQIQPAMRILLGAVALVFLVACVNVAGLVMGHALGRSRDFGIRAALGASRGRLMRSQLTESLLLSGIGGLAGVGIASGVVRLVRSLDVLSVPFLSQTRIDTTVVVTALVITAAAAILSGMAPAWRASRGDTSAVLGALGTRLTEGAASLRLRQILVAGEVMLATILLIGGGLLVRSFVSLTHVDLGFEPDHVQTAGVSLPDVSYRDPARRVAFVDGVMERLKARGDVAESAAIFGAPLTSFSYFLKVFDIDGVLPDETKARGPRVEFRAVTPGYFKAMDIPLLNGRDIAPSDRRGSAPVVVVSRTAARLLWPNTMALGHRVTIASTLGLGSGRVGGEVVGIVDDIHDVGPDASPRPLFYVSLAQWPMGFFTLVVKPRGDPQNFVSSLRAAVSEVDRDVPLFATRTMAERASRVVSEPRLYLQIVGLFSLVAITLAAVGIYGLMAQHVGARRREIGIRLALGATPRSAVALVLRQGTWLSLAGLVAGLATAFLLRGMVGKLLFNIQPTDALTYVLVAVATMAVALCAGWTPARRASRIDPLTTLRAD